MATTMKLIAKNVLGSDAATVTFSSIPATYDDLYIVVSARTGNTLTYIFDYLLIAFNGSYADFSLRTLEGDGSSVASYTRATFGVYFIGRVNGGNSTANTFGSAEIYIPNYAGSTNKSLSSTTVTEQNGTTAYCNVVAGLWSQTAAITSLTLDAEVDSFKSGSSFTLYGIKKA